jgi:hypothetical protein
MVTVTMFGYVFFTLPIPTYETGILTLTDLRHRIHFHKFNSYFKLSLVLISVSVGKSSGTGYVTCPVATHSAPRINVV